MLQLTTSKNLQPDDVDYVIYHNPCMDGTGSAYVAWKYLSNKFPERKVIYKPMSIGSPPPDDIDGKNVLMCDISYKKDVLSDILKRVNKFLVIDHHKTAEKELSNIDDKYKIFQMDHSGCILTWNYFYPDQSPPMLLKYIEDRDIWAKKLPDTEEFFSWFLTVDLTFEEYDKYLDDSILNQMIMQKGKGFIDQNIYYAKQALSHATIKFSKIKDKFYFVAYVNSSILKSDIGNQLLLKYPLIDFSVVYSIDDKTDATYFSLRSTDKHVDASEIASSMSGGGHRNASGVSLNAVVNHLPSKVFDNNKLYYQLSKIYFNILEINNKKYNIVYMFSTIYKTKLAMYLLQTKYQEKDKTSVQVCRDIYLKENKEAPLDTQISAVWSYDPNEDKTKFSIVIDGKITKEEKKSLDEWFGVDLNKGLVYAGLCKFLPLDIKPIKKGETNDTIE